MIVHTNKNEAFELVIPMVSVASPEAFLTGETVADTAYYKDGAGAWTSLAIADTFTEIGSTGLYEISLIAAEMNHDWIVIKMTSADAADTFVTFRLGSGPLVDIKAKTDLLGTGVVTFSGPVISNDEIELVQGDDYLNADSQAAEFTSTSWPSLSGATLAKLSFRLAGDPDDTVTTISGTVVDADTVRFDITAAQTGAMVTGTDVYAFDVQVTLSSGSIKTLIDPKDSRITVIKQITT